MRSWIGALVTALGGALWIFPAEAFAAGETSVQLAPHRAIYDITLDKSRSGAGLTGLTGRMVYELTGSSCEGYTQSMRFVTRMTNEEGSDTLSDLRSSSTEEPGGKTFHFSSSQYKNEKLEEQVAGDAARDNGAIKVELNRPRKTNLKFETKALFPIQHSIALLDAARAGRTLFTADLYDGSEKAEKVYATTAAIGRKLAPGYNKSLAAVKNAEVLDPLAAWPVSISYFETGKDNQDATPSYELAFVFYENGVSRRLFIDYGDFSIRGELKELTFLPVNKCEAK